MDYDAEGALYLVMGGLEYQLDMANDMMSATGREDMKKFFEGCAFAYRGAIDIVNRVLRQIAPPSDEPQIHVYRPGQH